MGEKNRPGIDRFHRATPVLSWTDLARRGVSVGNALAGVPLRRSVRAELSYAAPTSGDGGSVTKPHAAHDDERSTCRSGSVSGTRPPTSISAWSTAFPPPTPRARGTSPCSAASQVLHTVVRLLPGVHGGRPADGLPRPTPWDELGGYLKDLPCPARRVSAHAQGLRLRGVGRPLADGATAGVAYPSLNSVTHRRWTRARGTRHDNLRASVGSTEAAGN
jgi:hypothetical protein